VSNSSLIAIFIALGMLVWLLSGDITNEVVIADDAVSTETEASESDGDRDAVQVVRALRSEASDRKIYLAVRGQTRANRTVDVKSEISGVVKQLPGGKGRFVKTGDLLCEIAIDTRRSDLSQALADLKSAQLEYDGMRDLNKRGLQSEVNLAKAKASLEQSRFRAKHAELALQKTRILAPFDGVVEAQPVEVGDFMSPGASCVTLMEISPMLVVGRLAERDIGKVALGDTVKAQLITGEAYDAEISFIGRAPDQVTRTYLIEATIANPAESIRTGLTTNMQVPTGTEVAHLISPASLVLDDEGLVGVRIVDAENRVRFKTVDIVSEGAEGVWITGLPDTVDVITVGQEEVFEGQVVKVDYAPLTSLVSK